MGKGRIRDHKISISIIFLEVLLQKVQINGVVIGGEMEVNKYFFLLKCKKRQHVCILIGMIQ